jgi:MFS family permease
VSVASVTAPAPAPSALRLPAYRVHFATYLLAMMADSIEHVISYWVAFQKFQSTALGGFAVLSHWLPYLGFSVWVGALNDRFDARRLIQIGMVMFMAASAGWGYTFLTGSLQMWHAMLLLVLHGCAGVLWQTSNQVLLYDIVGTHHLPSAVRLNATARYIGFLAGPAVGGVIMLGLGPTNGILLNTAFYLPLLVWLVRAPYGRHHRVAGQAGMKRPVRGLADIVQTLRDVRGVPVIGAMLVLAGSASFFIGNSYQAQMPGFAHDLRHGNPGVAYSLLLGADALGALCAGFLLESRGGWLQTRASSAERIALLWGAALLAFSFARTYFMALPFLFLAGFFELSFSSMAQALVQIHAPEAIRGRVLGLFAMSSSGLRTFSGVTVGIAGSIVSIHASLAASSIAFMIVVAILLARQRPAAQTSQ